MIPLFFAILKLEFYTVLTIQNSSVNKIQNSSSGSDTFSTSAFVWEIKDKNRKIKCFSNKNPFASRESFAALKQT